MTEVTLTRWRAAQRAEAHYWSGVRADAAEVARILHAKAAAASWAEAHLAATRTGTWLEIGIGPLGVGWGHLMSGRGRRLVGVDPLPLLREDELELPAALAGVVRACRRDTYEHVQARGEHVPLPDGSFDVALTYNVLDHVFSPASVLAEMHRLLRPGGTALIACDAVSLLSQVKFRTWVARRRPDDPGVVAHPYRFRRRALLDLVEQAGLSVVATETRTPSVVYDLVGHAERVLVAARKADA